MNATEISREIIRLRSWIAFLDRLWFPTGAKRNDVISEAVQRLRSLRALRAAQP